MSEAEFTRSMIRVAESLKDGSLTDSERSRIISAFNNSTGSAYSRARAAIESVIGSQLPPDGLALEKAGAVNNLQNLLLSMNAAAAQWQASNKK